MDEESAETHPDEDLQTSWREDDPVKDVNSPRRLKLDEANQDQHGQDPESLKQDQERQSLQANLDPLQFRGKEGTRDEELTKCPPDQNEDRPEVLEVDHEDQDQDLGQTVDLSGVSAQDQDGIQHLDHNNPDQDQERDQDQELANQEVAGESGGGVPALIITQAEESCRCSAAPLVLELSPPGPSEPQRPADLVTPPSPADLGLGSGSDGGDMSCSDLLSLRSDSFSLTSEPTASRTSEEDDSHSVTASSVMSLFHRVQMDPLEKDWLRSSARGNVAAQRVLLSQEPSLAVKKDFITTALHWAAKQGRQEAVDMMLQSGADVNVRSGYTALHLASIHGHQHIVRTLINTYNAKTNVRDYHGKTALHYWSGGADVFSRPDAQSGLRCFSGRRTQRYALPSLLLSRSRSQGQLNLDFATPPPSASHDALDLHV